MADDNKKQSKKFKATTPGKRFLKLAGMSANIAKNIAAHKVKGLFSDDETHSQNTEQLYVNVGKQIAETLGEMKGAVMKVGQIASQMKDMLPPEVAEALKVLQNESPPMPYSVIRSQIIKELGDTPENLFQSFDEKPFAAASIGQVHRAVTKDGTECVVKIQYPGVKESCDSDLKHLRRALKLAGLLKVDAAVIDLTFEEIRRVLYEELDYEHEAENLKLFAEFYKNHPYVIIPELRSEVSSEKVLTLTYIEGDPLTAVKPPKYDQETINLIGFRIFETFGEQIYTLKTVHSDPHPGNFAFRPDGKIIIYDFGAVNKLPDETVANTRLLIEDALQGKLEALDQHLIALGIRSNKGKPMGGDFYEDWVKILLGPVLDYAPYDFSHANLHQQLIAKFKSMGFKHLGSFQPSPDTMLVQRVVSGHYWTMIELGANVSFRPLVDRIILEKVA